MKRPILALAIRTKGSTSVLSEIYLQGKMWNLGCLYELNKHLKQALWIILNNIPFWHNLGIYIDFSMWVLKAPDYVLPSLFPGLPWWLSDKESACSAGDVGSIPGLGRSPGEGNGNPLQFSCLGNPMNRGAWQATVHGVLKSQTWLSFWRGPLFPSVLYKIVFSQFFITQKFWHSWGKKY